MSLVRLIKQFVPTSIKAPIKEARRRRRLQNAFERYRRLPIDHDPPTDLLSELTSQWDNVGFSAPGAFIVEAIRQARWSPGPILECGSGLSTMLLGFETERRGVPLWTLEHHPSWAARMGDEVKKWSFKSLAFHQAPLRTYGEFAWYDPPLEKMPKDFALVICDGPPSETLGGRYGMLPLMSPRLRPGCLILLDDYGRAEEQAIAARWVQESGACLEIKGGERPYAMLKLPG